MKIRIAISMIWLVALISATPSAWAETIAVRAGAHDGYGRMVFRWSLPVQYDAVITGNRLRVTFQEPAETSYQEVLRNLRRYISAAQPSQGGRQVDFTLTNDDYALRSFYTGSFLVLDVIGTPRAQTPPPVPEPAPTPTVAPAPVPAPAPTTPQVTQNAQTAPISGPTVRVRKGEHPTYTRIVFDWTRKVGYSVDDYDQKTVIRFDDPARYNLAAAQRGRSGTVLGAQQRDGQVVELDVRAGSRIKHFYAGSKVVVDVYRDTLANKATAPSQTVAQAAPGPQPAPAVATPAPTPAPQTPAPAPAQPTVAEAPASSEPAQPVAAPTQQVVASPAPAVEPAAPTEPNASGLAAPFALRFDFGEPVAAAAFRRGGAVWIAFDTQTQQDLDFLRRQAGSGIQSIEQLDVPRATVLRIIPASGFNPRPRREGLAWIFDFAKLPLIATEDIDIAAQPNSPVGARLFANVQESGLPLAVQDPDVGDNLIVVPVIPLGHGVNEARRYPQFSVLQSAQGLVYQPLSDDIRLRSVRNGVEVMAASSLKLTPPSPKGTADAKLGGLRSTSRIFDFDKWKLGPFEDYRENKQEMEKAVAGLRGPRRDIARVSLAQFYLSHGMAAEALGVLNVLAKSDPDRLLDMDYKALHGVANYLMGRLDEAAQDFDDPRFQDSDEGQFWQAILKAGQGNLVEAAPDLKRLAGVVRPYPPRLKFPVGLLLTEASLSIGDVRQAESYLEVLEAERLGTRQDDAVTYLKARAQEIGGDPDGALTLYEEVEEGDHRPSRARATLAKYEMLYSKERVDEKTLIENLEGLRFAWRGDDFEFNLLRRLGDLYVETGDYRNGLRTLRQAATYFRDHPNSKDITDEMVRIFEDLYLNSKADELPPVTAIALYDEFRELTPAGDKGDEMIRLLADRLAAVDLLREAAELLENQVQFRLSGLKKAQVGTRLALVYIAGNRPDRAIRALKKSRVSNIPPEEILTRRHLEARALIDMSKEKEAIQLLDVAKDASLQADRLRSEVYWNAGDWRNASAVLRRMILAEGARRGQPLTQEQSRLVLNLAVAYTLGNNERGVKQVDDSFGQAMAETSLRDAFQLIAKQENAGMLDPRTITQMIKPAENFKSFMDEYQQRLKAGELSTING